MIFEKKRVLMDVFDQINKPICIINKNNIITNGNENFINEFNNVIFNQTNFELFFNPLKILSEVTIEIEQNKYLISYVNFNNEFAIIFNLLQKTDLKWWQNLPFPVAIIDENNLIKEVNYSFEDLVSSNIFNKSIYNFTKKFDISKALAENGQEVIWNTNKGYFPICTWVKYYEDKKIIFLENRIEFIKLKNNAQKSQHLQILGQLASNIIHDFNNLLTSICGFTDLLEEKMPNDEALSQIRRNVDQAAQLANELLNFIKEKPVEEKLSEPKKFIPTMHLMLKKLLNQNIKLQFNNDFEGKIPISEMQLEQIILNMMLNSKDVMPDGGIFTIKTYKKTFLKKTKIINQIFINAGNYCTIEISDTGSGISKENQEKIFSAFFTTKTKGTGLGLASCMRIVEHASGGINFKTNSNGTTFFIYIPMIEESAIQNKNISSKNIKIMLVEDEEIIRNLIKKSLEQENYIVKGFSNGIDAINALNSSSFDLIITDAVLPGVNGSQIAQTAYEKNNNAKILLISGYCLEELEDKFPKTIKYLAKPFKIKDLKEKIKSMI